MSNSKLSPEVLKQLHIDAIDFGLEYKGEEQYLIIEGYDKGAKVEAEKAANILSAKDAEITELNARYDRLLLTASSQERYIIEKDEENRFKGITCLECNVREATEDYNGHRHYVCQLCMDSLSREFDNDYN